MRYIHVNDKNQPIFKFISSDEYNSKYKDNDIIELTNGNLDRIKFKHLYIEKLVNKNTGSVVGIGDFLTYTIIIQNYGKENYKEDLFVEENLSQFVSFEIYYSNDTSINFEYNKNNRKLIWKIGKLKAKEEKIIYYIVKVISGKPDDVKENIGYVGNIRSSVVKNVIGINLNKKQKNAIKNNFEKLKSKYDGKILINEVYKQTFNIDLKFDVFDVTKLIINSNLSSAGLSTLYLNISNELYNFILNKCWSSLSKRNYTYIKGGEIVTIYNEKINHTIPKEIVNRNDFLYEKIFQTGDILYYINHDDIVYSVENNKLIKNYITYENGEYTYIYVEGKGFVGINLGDDGIRNTKDDRNEFTAKYYNDNNLKIFNYSENETDELLEIGNLQTVFGKDYYVIIRPSLRINISKITFIEHESGSKVALIIVLLLLFIIAVFGFFILYKYLIMKRKGIEFNFTNLKTHLI